MAITAKLRSIWEINDANSPDIGQATYRAKEAHEVEFTAGNGTGQIDKEWTDTRTLAASATENLDLAGSLTNALGNTVVFAKVKAIRIRASSANTNNVVVGGAGSNTFTGPFADATDKISIPPGGIFSMIHPTTGWTVTASTGDILLVANSSSGTGVDYDIEILGCS
jgi:hypothetical protein